jgi:hypothetical protein
VTTRTSPRPTPTPRIRRAASRLPRRRLSPDWSPAGTPPKHSGYGLSPDQTGPPAWAGVEEAFLGHRHLTRRPRRPRARRGLPRAPDLDGWPAADLDVAGPLTSTHPPNASSDRTDRPVKPPRRWPPARDRESSPRAVLSECGSVVATRRCASAFERRRSTSRRHDQPVSSTASSQSSTGRPSTPATSSP